MNGRKLPTKPMKEPEIFKIKQEYREKFGSNPSDYSNHLNAKGYSCISSLDDSLSIFYLPSGLVVVIGSDGIDFLREA